MQRPTFFLYGLACYTVFLGVFVYAVAFLGNYIVPHTIDAAPRAGFGVALAVNLALAVGFALQHSGMARPTFKRWWTRLVPAPIERATYVLASNAAMILLFVFWQPMGGELWHVEHPAARLALQVLQGGGWLLVLVSTFLIDHFELFGLKQVWNHLNGRPLKPKGFVTPGPYKLVRHPLYVGWLVVFWAAPTMTVGHLILALAITGYILVAIQLEERNLEDELGAPYAAYRRSVPMLIPGTAMSSRGESKRAGQHA